LEEKHRFHPYPDILALGILLLQLWLGSPIEGFRDADNPNNRQDKPYNIDSDLPAAEKMLEKCEGDSLPEYNDAIRACLDSGTFDRGLSFDDEKLQRQIHGKIVKLIEKVIDAYRVDPDAESKLPPDAFINWKDLSFDARQPSAQALILDEGQKDTALDNSKYNSQNLSPAWALQDAKSFRSVTCRSSNISDS
jgi:hypothetical protein